MLRFRSKTTLSNPRVLRAFEGLGSGGRRRVLGAMAEEFALVTKQNFGPTGRSRPSKWAPLSIRYRRWKARKVGSSYADLIFSGNLKRSVRWEATNDNFSTVTVGEGIPYAATHQHGTSKIPARPFVPMVNANTPTPYMKRRLEKVAEREIAKIIQGK